MSYLLSTKLKPIAKKLRGEFESILKDHHSPRRFQWDWWHLPGRYTHLRTPAATFFSQENHELLREALQDFGRQHLGCQNISPIWVSAYVEGCEQRLHADRPHGPWAFVLSLTKDPRAFEGGETVILRPEVLSLWNQGVPAGRAFEEKEVLERIPSEFGRLVIFDPRIPHGVSRTSGTLDPLEGRLVVHGWFAQPSPFIEGPLAPAAAEKSLAAFDEFLAQSLEASFPDGFNSTGTISFQIHITPTGQVKGVKQQASSLASANPELTLHETRLLTSILKKHFTKWAFPRAKSASTLYLPLSFEH
ncbi:MAG: 2OG-Fe(II) oxygenase [Bdellovibrionales bacterium]|jgi:Rps23 Pro-64 3,4-dihydroxylase Tpa1-like proline 4-hydroxylase|nr:2OG-Fe(II) oxygenase [Bdellovibrionales bacterium]